jgi:endonuclease YncB( thermonuclease family)
VRVLAIDSTELNSDEPWGPDCWALEAKARAEELLPEGTDVWLTFDGEVEDVYRRLLAYVWVGRAPHDVAFEDSFNWTMVREGQAYTFFFDNNRTWEDTLRSAEQDARNEGLGVWSCP